MEHPKEQTRSQRRVEAAIPIQVRGMDVTGLQYDDSTTAVEVSRRGLSFLTKRELAICASLTVVIPGLGPSRPDEGPTDFFTEAIVVTSAKEDDDLYRVGIRFMGATLHLYSPEGT